MQCRYDHAELLLAQQDVASMTDSNRSELVFSRSDRNELLNSATSPQWRHPASAVPEALVVRSSVNESSTESAFQTLLKVDHDIPALH